MNAEPHDYRSARDPNTPPEQLEVLLARDPVNLLASVRENPALSLLQLEHPSLMAAIERADEAVRQKQMAKRIMQLPPEVRRTFAARCALRVCSLLSDGDVVAEALRVFSSGVAEAPCLTAQERAEQQQTLRRAARTLQGISIAHPTCAEDHARLAAAHVANASMSSAVHAASQASAAMACSGGSLLAELRWQQDLLGTLLDEVAARPVVVRSSRDWLASIASL